MHTSIYVDEKILHFVVFFFLSHTLFERIQNDIIGPTGFGDARFIAGDTLLDYKIRFENDPNATAPAQRVVIRHKLDVDLDPRTFRIGSFGFGNFTKVQTPRPLLQVW
jgi:hypothetical protein